MISTNQFTGIVHNAPGPETPEILSRRHEQAMETLGWHHTRTFAYNTTVRRMRDRRHSFPGLAPLSLYPFEIEDVADLMLGHLDMFTILNVKALERQFERRDLDVEIVPPEDPAAGDVFLTARRRRPGREIFVRVHPTVREQLVRELMRPESAVASVKAVLDAAEAEPEPVEVERIPAMAAEAAVWEDRG